MHFVFLFSKLQHLLFNRDERDTGDNGKEAEAFRGLNSKISLTTA
jgi:hypothetical protein